MRRSNSESVRAHLSNLKFEKETLVIVKANTSIAVPEAYDYYRSAEFKHLVLERLPGVTLENPWPNLPLEERTRIAEQVVSFLAELRNLSSPNIKVAIYQRKPLRAGIRVALILFKNKLANLREMTISRYVGTRIGCLNLSQWCLHTVIWIEVIHWSMMIRRLVI